MPSCPIKWTQGLFFCDWAENYKLASRIKENLLCLRQWEYIRLNYLRYCAMSVETKTYKISNILLWNIHSKFIVRSYFSSSQFLLICTFYFFTHGNINSMLNGKNVFENNRLFVLFMLVLSKNSHVWHAWNVFTPRVFDLI